MRDLKTRLSLVVALAAVALAANATVNGPAVDLAGHQGATVQITSGTVTDGTHTFVIQESDDGATFTDVADADLLGGQPAAFEATDDAQAVMVGYIGTKRYIRVAVTTAGATTGGLFQAAVLLGFPRHTDA